MRQGGTMHQLGCCCCPIVSDLVLSGARYTTTPTSRQQYHTLTPHPHPTLASTSIIMNVHVMYKGWDPEKFERGVRTQRSEIPQQLMDGSQGIIDNDLPNVLVTSYHLHHTHPTLKTGLISHVSCYYGNFLYIFLVGKVAYYFYFHCPLFYKCQTVHLCNCL